MPFFDINTTNRLKLEDCDAFRFGPESSRLQGPHCCPVSETPHVLEMHSLFRAQDGPGLT